MTTPALFKSAAPCFSVRDVPGAITFYCDKLGFKTGHLEGRPPVYATLSRDNVSLHLRADHQGTAVGTDSCCIFVDNADAVFEACKAAGVNITRPIENSPYGLRDFTIADPEGNTILFGHPWK